MTSAAVALYSNSSATQALPVLRAPISRTPTGSEDVNATSVRFAAPELQTVSVNVIVWFSSKHCGPLEATVKLPLTTTTLGTVTGVFGHPHLLAGLGTTSEILLQASSFD